MNATTACCAPTIPLHRPLLHRWAADLRTRWQQWFAARRAVREQQLDEHDLHVLEGLSAHTLADIGAPEWVRVRAAERRAAEQLHLLQHRGGHDAGHASW